MCALVEIRRELGKIENNYYFGMVILGHVKEFRLILTVCKLCKKYFLKKLFS